jgi:nicotinamidase/pyrazinamidase
VHDHRQAVGRAGRLRQGVLTWEGETVEPLPLRQSSLLVVDAQRGFTTLCPAELPVPGGLEIVPAVNELLALPWARVDASQDWHPPDHCSFLGQRDNLYPPHCVMGTPGADFLPGLHTERFGTIWRKGYERDCDAYAVTAQHPGFVALLQGSGIAAVVVCGLAANICCYYAARDLRRAGLRVLLAEDASAGIDVPAAGLWQAQAKEEGQRLGIEYVTVQVLFSSAEGNLPHEWAGFTGGDSAGA